MEIPNMEALVAEGPWVSQTSAKRVPGREFVKSIINQKEPEEF
jgi:hypothetical protein